MPKGMPAYSFWPGIMENGTWVSYPDNFLSIIEALQKMPKFLKKFCQNHGLDWLFLDLNIFKLPSDSDDSGVNLALGRLLFNNKDVFPEIWKKW